MAGWAVIGHMRAETVVERGLTRQASAWHNRAMRTAPGRPMEHGESLGVVTDEHDSREDSS